MTNFPNSREDAERFRNPAGLKGGGAQALWFTEDIKHPVATPAGDNDLHSVLEYVKTRTFGLNANDVAALKLLEALANAGFQNSTDVTMTAATGTLNVGSATFSAAPTTTGATSYVFAFQVPTARAADLTVRFGRVIITSSDSSEGARAVPFSDFQVAAQGGTHVTFTLSNGDHPETTGYTAANTYTFRFQEYHIDLSALTDQDNNLGPWADIAAGTAIKKGQVTHHGTPDVYYISLTDHTKAGQGPDADTTNWSVLTNFAGPFVGDRFYHAGAIVSHVGELWMASGPVINTGPFPNAVAPNNPWRLISIPTDLLDADGKVPLNSLDEQVQHLLEHDNTAGRVFYIGAANNTNRETFRVGYFRDFDEANETIETARTSVQAPAQVAQAAIAYSPHHTDFFATWSDEGNTAPTDDVQALYSLNADTGVTTRVGTAVQFGIPALSTPDPHFAGRVQPTALAVRSDGVGFITIVGENAAETTLYQSVWELSMSTGVVRRKVHDVVGNSLINDIYSGVAVSAATLWVCRYAHLYSIGSDGTRTQLNSGTTIADAGGVRLLSMAYDPSDEELIGVFDDGRLRKWNATSQRFEVFGAGLAANAGFRHTQWGITFRPGSQSDLDKRVRENTTRSTANDHRLSSVEQQVSELEKRHTGGFEDSNTIGINADEEAFLFSPGRDGIWAASTAGSDSAVGTNLIWANTARFDTKLATMLPATLGRGLSDYFAVGTEGFSVLRHLDPKLFNGVVRIVFIDDTVTDVILVRKRGSVTTGLRTIDAAIPASTSAASPHIFTHDFDVSDFHINDRVSIQIQGLSTASQAQVLNAVQSVRMDFPDLEDSIVHDLVDTFPVQSRPRRDLVSYDESVITDAKTYGAGFGRYPTVQNHKQGLLKEGFGGDAGVGFEPVTASRDNTYTLHADHRTVNYDDNHQGEIKFTAPGTFTIDLPGTVFALSDHTNNPGSPDNITARLIHMTQAAAEANTSAWPADDATGVTVLDEQTHIIDIDEIQDSVPWSFEGNDGDLVPTIPDTISKWFKWFDTRTTPGGEKVARVGYNTDAVLRLQMSLNVTLIGDPRSGASAVEVTVYDADHATTGDITRHSMDLPTNGTPGAPAEVNWNFFDSDGGGRNSFAAPANIDDFLFAIIRKGDSTDVGGIDVDAFRSVSWIVKIWVATPEHLNVHLHAEGVTVAENDRISAYWTNVAPFTFGNRVINWNHGNIHIVNTTDAAGRSYSETATRGADGRLHLNTGDHSDWFANDGGAIVLRRDAKQVTVRVACRPTTAGTRVKITRQAPGLTSRETLGVRVITATDAITTVSASGQGFVAGDRIEAEIDGALNGNATFSAIAIATPDADSRQVRVQGTDRPVLAVNHGARSANQNITRLDLEPGFDWRKAAGVLKFYWRHSSTSFVEWNVMGSIDIDMIFTVGSNPASGDDSVLTPARNVNNSDRRIKLFDDSNQFWILPLDDGGLAISTGVAVGAVLAYLD